MSTLQVANIWFESTGNNRIQYNGSNNYLLTAGGATAMTVNTTSVSYTANVTYSATVTVSGTVNFATANVANQLLVDGATINWDVSQGMIATVSLAGNRTLANPTNLKVGTLMLIVNQDGTGGRTLSFGSAYKWPAATAPVLTTTAAAKDIISFYCDGTNLYGSFLPDVR